MPGNRLSGAARRSASLRMAACGATGMPWLAMKAFSAMRSCTMATASAAGLTRQRVASARRLSAGTFSNSVVTA